MENLLVLVQSLAVWAYAVIFVIMLLENLGLPLPGQTFALVAAVVAGHGQLNFGLVYLVTIAGGSIGAVGGYWIGRKGGCELLERYGRFVLISPQRLTKAEKFFQRHGYKTLLISRYIPILCFAIGMLSGITRLDFRRFWLPNLLGMTLWATTHLTLGLLLGSSLNLLNQTLNGAGLLVILGVILAVVFSVLRKTWLNRNQSIKLNKP